jgi:hypothetical protein
VLSTQQQESVKKSSLTPASTQLQCPMPHMPYRLLHVLCVPRTSIHTKHEAGAEVQHPTGNPPARYAPTQPAQGSVCKTAVYSRCCQCYHLLAQHHTNATTQPPTLRPQQPPASSLSVPSVLLPACPTPHHVVVERRALMLARPVATQYIPLAGICKKLNYHHTIATAPPSPSRPQQPPASLLTVLLVLPPRHPHQGRLQSHQWTHQHSCSTNTQHSTAREDPLLFC